MRRTPIGLLSCLILLCLSARVQAASNGPGPFFTLLAVSYTNNYTSTSADTVEGAFYSRSYSNPASLKIELGLLPMKYLYLGFVFDLWKAGRTFEVGGITTSDTLTYQVVGVELGYITGNPRSFVAFTGFVGYPLRLSIQSSTGATYLPDTAAPLTYGGRAMIGLRFASFLSVLMEGGYRLRNLGAFSADGVAYLGDDFNLSGFFISTGVGFTL